ncbi:hypothetical protein P8881_19820 [Bacillus haynesii]|uniref:hypothetical protein n=1 Tax=Bacillus haynesii TaxID=1925021 RepID=UPI0022829245|nr:hypothetical protein [Bacillus haynesii]MCY8737583.1 hypothetical protein [Bacillus haynesii]MEC0709776.1 hypothetical protein [Bacillus haynesii]MEC0736845.1 hypothetical protein [Bacillus haynesii]
MEKYYEFTYRGYSVQYKIVDAPENPGVDSFLELTAIPKCFGELDGDLFLTEEEIKGHIDYILDEEGVCNEGTV